MIKAGADPNSHDKVGDIATVSHETFLMVNI